MARARLRLLAPLLLLTALTGAPRAIAAGPPLIYQDSFPSGFQVALELGAVAGDTPSLGGLVPLAVAGYGPTTVLRSDPYLDPETNTLAIDTEIINMDLHGVSPVLGNVTINESDTQRSTGKITNVVLDQNGELIQGDSYFNVFFKVTATKCINANCVLQLGAFNLTAFQVVNKITHLPPTLDPPYYHPAGKPVSLWAPVNNAVRPVGYSTSGCHKVLPPAGQHALCLTVSGKALMPGCVRGPALVRASDASNPPHVLTGVTGAATGPGTVVTTPWTDIDGDGIWEALVTTTNAGCVALSLTATGTLGDVHTATGTIGWTQQG